MANYTEERLLIVTKTYPTPSISYRETSCVAGINETGSLRRLYPIPFRLMKAQNKFLRWEWIKGKVKKAIGDDRPESYRIDIDSITPLSKINTADGWSERLEWLEPNIVGGFKSLEERRQKSGETMGFIRPKKVSLLIKKSDEADWGDVQKTALSKESLLDPEEVKKRPPLRKVPFSFYYLYECEDAPGIAYKHKINDWEICQLYWNCEKAYGPTWEAPFRQKVEGEFSTAKDLILMMGTIHRFPDQWLIIGVIYPPKVSARKLALFPYVPSA